MGIAEKISGFFEKKPKEVCFKDAEEIVFFELETEEKELEDISSKKFAEIKHLLKSLSQNAVVLENHEIKLDEGNKRFRQIVVTSQKNLVRQLQGLSSRLMPPQKINTKEIQDYSISSIKAITQDLLPYWKNVALTKLLLKDEIKSIGEDLTELSEIFKQLNEKSFSEKIVSNSSLKNGFESFHLKENEKSELTKKVAEKEKRLTEIKNQIEQGKGKGEEKRKSTEYKKLFDLKSKIRIQDNEKSKVISMFNSEIAPVEKILKRMLVLSENTALLDSTEKDVLKAVLSSPESAVVIDPQGTKLKVIFAKAEKLLKEGAISMKEKEEGKKMIALTALLEKDFFSQYFWTLNKIKAERSHIEKEISAMSISSEIAEIESSIYIHGNELLQIKKELESVKKELDDCENNCSSIFKKIEKKFNQLYEKKYKLKS